ncbi:protein tyrosine phosphatase [Aristophania vespae]|uniref:Protein tyrosine phosphatase n=1 Tax=Aristophania vespae TaxID=2697033 RepID=A0A6P1NJF1_9PROT|nr:tyrosine-protein phosphatase [Aristophania vespae]QHI94991.1 protein tyrosine phosphatase [Aristophania vespae]UMM64160.1 hypothetical protein DM15PD_11520 [Aristophania vespae]
MFNNPLSTPYNFFQAWIDSLFVDHAIFRLLWTNLAPVINGKVWRSNHPTPARIKKLKNKLHLKSIINLRGHRQCGSDALGRAFCHSINLPYIDMAFESRNAPHRERILKFYSIYKTIPTPTLIHCKSGADRAGLASGLIILFEGGKANEALKHLNWRYLHFKRSRTGVLDAFFLLYQREAEGKMPFIEWVRSYYDEQKLREEFKAGLWSHLLTDHVLRRE